MKTTFYDVKLRKKVKADVVKRQKYQANGSTRYALKGKTSDGRSLTRFVSKADFDAATV